MVFPGPTTRDGITAMSNNRFHMTIIQRFLVATFVCYLSVFKTTCLMGGGVMEGERNEETFLNKLHQTAPSTSTTITTVTSSSSGHRPFTNNNITVSYIRGRGSNRTNNATVVFLPANFRKKGDPVPFDPTLPNITNPDYFREEQWRILLPQWTEERQAQKEQNQKLVRDKIRPDPSTSPRILVVYSGPTHAPIDPAVLAKENNVVKRKNELYRVNFEHFLEYGIQCRTQDTVVVVTDVIEPIYRRRIDGIHRQCQDDFGTQVRMVVRNSTCYDMETVRRVIRDKDVFSDDELLKYDYFVYANCGTSGPSRLWAELPWTDVFIEPMKANPKIKMTGLTMNCPTGSPRAHIQSMMYALDRVGLSLVRDKKHDVVYDCIRNGDLKSIINNYEIGLSKVVLNHGYAISPIIAPTVLTRGNQSLCQLKGMKYHQDIWTTMMTTKVFNRTLDLDETIFAKTSRIMSETTKQQIRYNYTMNWSW
jgi:hypothetical protein